jgi:hypothetical protein
VENILLPCGQALEDGLRISKLTFFVNLFPIIYTALFSAGRKADYKAFLLGIQFALSIIGIYRLFSFLSSI